MAGAIEPPQSAPQTVGALVAAFCSRRLASTGRPLSAATLRAYRSHLQALIETTGAGYCVHDVSASHVRAACARPPSAASRASYLRSIRCLWRWALRAGYVYADPCADVVIERPPRKVGAYLLAHEIAPFIAACSDDMAIRAAFIIATGLRAGEAVALRWSWVSEGIGRPTIRIPAYDSGPGWEWKTKGHCARAIPLSLAAQEALRAARERWPAGPCVLHSAPQALAGSGTWARAIRAARARARPSQPVDTQGLRRTAATRWLAAGVTIYDVSRLLGHSSVTVTERYYAGFCDHAWAGVMDTVDAAAQAPTIGQDPQLPLRLPRQRRRAKASK